MSSSARSGFCTAILTTKPTLKPWRVCFTSRALRQNIRRQTTVASHTVRTLDVPDLSYATQQDHIGQVGKQLKQAGILKISLGFDDDDSNYLKRLLCSLNKHQGHQLPITHSAKRGWFWDVRPSTNNFQAGNHQARSETMEEFPWHTDCSYEDTPPRYFALHVLQHDRHGGGTLSVMSAERLCELLTAETRAALSAPNYRITIPPEFIKDLSRTHITGSLLGTSPITGSTVIRFRRDIVSPLTDEAAEALDKLGKVLGKNETQAYTTMHFDSADLPSGSIILMDNRRWLHSRNDIKDPERHLRRVRWDACPFDNHCT